MHVRKYQNRLFKAILENQVDNVKPLVDAKADVNACNKKSGVTPLAFAAYKGYTAIVLTLLEAKANANSFCKGKGCRPLIVASHCNHLDIAKALLDAKAKPDLPIKKQVIQRLYILSQKKIHPWRNYYWNITQIRINKIKYLAKLQ